MEERWRLHAWHILDCIKKIQVIEERGSIINDFVLYDAVLRNLQTLSESTSHLPDIIKEKYNTIHWKSIIGFRNILVHDYLGEIDSNTVEKILSEYLPELEEVIKDITKK
jgi:uncharacterized protein with HEPN domain